MVQTDADKRTARLMPRRLRLKSITARISAMLSRDRLTGVRRLRLLKASDRVATHEDAHGKVIRGGSRCARLCADTVCTASTMLTRERLLLPRVFEPQGT